MLSIDPLSVLCYFVFGNMSQMFFETCPATDNPIKSVVKLSTTDDVGRYNFRPRYNFNVTELLPMSQQFRQVGYAPKMAGKKCPSLMFMCTRVYDVALCSNTVKNVALSL